MSEAGFLKDGSAVSKSTGKQSLIDEAARRGLDTSGSKSKLYNRLVEATEEGVDGANPRDFTQSIAQLPKKSDPRKSMLCRLGLVTIPPPPQEDFVDIRIPGLGSPGDITRSMHYIIHTFCRLYFYQKSLSARSLANLYLSQLWLQTESLMRKSPLRNRSMTCPLVTIL